MSVRAVDSSAEEEQGVALGRISRASLSDRAYEEIRSALMRSRLKRGERLLLRPLSATLGISATPVREALLRLVSEGALTMNERGKVEVPRYGRERLREIIGLRIFLEGQSAARAAEIAQAAAIDELASHHEAMRAAEEGQDFAAALEANERFHFALCRLAAMPVYFKMVESLWMQVGPLQPHLYDGPILRYDIHPHERVVEALRRRDPDGARDAIAEDITRAGESLMPFLD